MRIGIAALVPYIPSQRISVRARAAALGLSDGLVSEKIGFFELSRRNADEDTSDLALKAISALLQRDPDLRARVRLLVVVTQTPDGRGLPHVSAIVHGRLNLSLDVAAFDISLGCSGWIYGLSIAKSFMESNGIEDGLLVTSDCYSKIVDENDRNTSLIFGDAACVTHLSSTAPEWTVGRCVFGTDGTRAADLQIQPSGRLAMNGRGVFAFSATRVPPCISQTLAENEMVMADVDKVLLHQGSRYIVDTIGERLGVKEKTPFLAAQYGNVVASSLPIMLSNLPAADRKVVACGFGVGLSWSATVFTRV